MAALFSLVCISKDLDKDFGKLLVGNRDDHSLVVFVDEDFGMSSTTNTIISDIEMEEWSDLEEEDQEVSNPKDIDCRRMIENKLEDLRLLKETNEFNFDF